MSPTLLTLPPELRNQILESLFFGAELSTLCMCHRPNPFRRANYGVLAANKQLHREASNILFHGAVLRLQEVSTDNDDTPHITTKNVIPVWSWLIRDRYRELGTDVEFLQRWQGLKKVRHVEVSLHAMWYLGDPLFPDESRDVQACRMIFGFVRGLPELESLMVYTLRDDAAFLEKELMLPARSATKAKVIMIPVDPSSSLFECQF